MLSVEVFLNSDFDVEWQKFKLFR